MYGSETWAFSKRDERRIEALEMLIWRKIRRVNWVVRLTKKEVLRLIRKKGRCYEQSEKERRTGLSIT